MLQWNINPMIITTILTFIIAISLSPISPINLARVASIMLLYSAFLSFNVLYLECLESGIGIYSGLYQISTISQSIETFIYVIAALILIPWFIYPLNSNKLGSNSLITGPILSEYSLLLLFSVLGSTLLISSTDLISMYLSIELQSFAVYILATIHRDSESSTSAGLKYFLLGGLSSCIILLGAALIYSYTGSTNIELILALLSTLDMSSSSSILPVLGLLFILIGFLFKVAAAPLHNWAPDVYDEVPSIVTTWLTIMPKIAIFIFLLELITSSLLANGLDVNIVDSFNNLTAHSAAKNILLVSSLISIVIGSVVGLAQYKIKRLLAYSTISHVGFLLLALGINTESSTESLVFYLLQYSVTNLNTFLILLAFGYTLKSLNLFNPNSVNNNLSNNKGIASDFNASSSLDIKYISELKAQFVSNPLLSIGLALCLFSMAGIPPLVGFFAKQQVLYSATSSGYYFISIVAIIMSVVSASYYLQIIKVMHFTSTGPLVISSSNSKDDVHYISNAHSMLISTLTLSILLFILNPTIVLNSTHLLALTLFNY